MSRPCAHRARVRNVAGRRIGNTIPSALTGAATSTSIAGSPAPTLFRSPTTRRRPTTATIARRTAAAGPAGPAFRPHIHFAANDASKILACHRVRAIIFFGFQRPLSTKNGRGRECDLSETPRFFDISIVHRISVKKLSFGAGHRRTRCYNPARSRGKHKRPDGSERSRCPKRQDARIAQLVEQRIENPRVGGSNPPPGTIPSSRRSWFLKRISR